MGYIEEAMEEIKTATVERSADGVAEVIEEKLKQSWKNGISAGVRRARAKKAKEKGEKEERNKQQRTRDKDIGRTTSH